MNGKSLSLSAVAVLGLLSAGGCGSGVASEESQLRFVQRLIDSGYKGTRESDEDARGRLREAVLVRSDGVVLANLDLRFTKCYLFLKWDGTDFTVSHATGNGKPVVPEGSEAVKNPSPVDALELINKEKKHRYC